MRPEPEPPAQHPKQKALTQGGLSTPKVPKAATQTHQATPPGTSLQGKKFVEDLYRHVGGEGGPLWESSYYPGIEKVEARKRKLIEPAYYGLRGSVEEEVDRSSDDEGDDDAEIGDME